MPDVFADINSAGADVLAMIGDILEGRAQIPSQQAMLHSYLSEIEFPAEAKVLEVGCGTGPVCRTLAVWPNVGEVVGVDLSSVLLERARSLSVGLDNVSYMEADGTALSFDDGAFDVVVLHTLLTHVPAQEAVLAEARRVVQPQGWLAVCDGDFSTASVSIVDEDPLEACVAAFVEGYVTDPFLVRRMRSLVAVAGFEPGELASYGLVETVNPGLTLSWIDRGADALVAQARITAESGEAHKQEARARVAAGTWFGYMAYASLIARPSP